MTFLSNLFVVFSKNFKECILPCANQQRCSIYALTQFTQCCQLLPVLNNSNVIAKIANQSCLYTNEIKTVWELRTPVILCSVYLCEIKQLQVGEHIRTVAVVNGGVMRPLLICQFTSCGAMMKSSVYTIH